MNEPSMIWKAALAACALVAVGSLAVSVIFVFDQGQQVKERCTAIRDAFDVHVDALARAFDADPHGPEAEAYRADLLTALEGCE